MPARSPLEGHLPANRPPGACSGCLGTATPGKLADCKTRGLTFFFYQVEKTFLQAKAGRKTQSEHLCPCTTVPELGPDTSLGLSGPRPRCPHTQVLLPTALLPGARRLPPACPRPTCTSPQAGGVGPLHPCWTDKHLSPQPSMLGPALRAAQWQRRNWNPGALPPGPMLCLR